VSHDAHFVALPTFASEKNPIKAAKKRPKRAHVEIADDEGEGKTVKRLSWTSEEDDRLVSLPLNLSHLLLLMVMSIFT
jgi:hypothetical protein